MSCSAHLPLFEIQFACEVGYTLSEGTLLKRSHDGPADILDALNYALLVVMTMQVTAIRLQHLFTFHAGNVSYKVFSVAGIVSNGAEVSADDVHSTDNKRLPELVRIDSQVRLLVQ